MIRRPEFDRNGDTISSDFEFEIQSVGPFRLDLTTWVLRRRAHNEIDVWDDDTSRYSRSLVVGGDPVALTAFQVGGSDDAAVRVRVTGSSAGASHRSEIRSVLKNLLGLERDLSGFMRMVSSDPEIGLIAERMRGVKPPRFPTAFEALVNGIACQQISLEAGIHLLNRLARGYGPEVSGDGGARSAFPGPEELASLEPEELRELGFSFNKACAIVEASREIVNGELDLEGIERLDDDDACRRLTELRGVGRWTAEYVLLRGLGRIHVFPGDDVGANNKLRQLFDVGELSYENTQDLVSRWQPYAGLVYFHLLLASIEPDRGSQGAGRA